MLPLLVTQVSYYNAILCCYNWCSVANIKSIILSCSLTWSSMASRSLLWGSGTYMHYDLSQFVHPIIKVIALCISQGSFFKFFYESVAVFNFCGTSVGEHSRSVFAKGRVEFIKTFAFSLRLTISCMQTSITSVGYRVGPSDVNCHRKRYLTIIITSSMVYSGVKASEHLCIIIIVESFIVRRKTGTVSFFDLLQTSSTATAPASVYLLSLPTSRLKLSLQLIQFSILSYTDKPS